VTVFAVALLIVGAALCVLGRRWMAMARADLQGAQVTYDRAIAALKDANAARDATIAMLRRPGHDEDV